MITKLELSKEVYRFLKKTIDVKANHETIRYAYVDTYDGKTYLIATDRRSLVKIEIDNEVTPGFYNLEENNKKYYIIKVDEKETNDIYFPSWKKVLVDIKGNPYSIATDYGIMINKIMTDKKTIFPVIQEKYFTRIAKLKTVENVYIIDNKWIFTNENATVYILVMYMKQD
jgi:hypothetical protein